MPTWSSFGFPQRNIAPGVFASGITLAAFGLKKRCSLQFLPSLIWVLTAAGQSYMYPTGILKPTSLYSYHFSLASVFWNLARKNHSQPSTIRKVFQVFVLAIVIITSVSKAHQMFSWTWIGKTTVWIMHSIEWTEAVSANSLLSLLIFKPSKHSMFFQRSLFCCLPVIICHSSATTCFIPSSANSPKDGLASEIIFNTVRDKQGLYLDRLRQNGLAKRWRELLSHFPPCAGEIQIPFLLTG